MFTRYFEDEEIKVVVKHYREFKPRKSGYGNKLPTDWRVKLSNGRWYNVYAICYSNSASHYSIVGGEKVFYKDYQLEVTNGNS
jgi:hypothetical protein